jgi:hypothetical protein
MEKARGRKAAFAEDDILTSFGCRKETIIENGERVDVLVFEKFNTSFRSFHGLILNAKEHVHFSSLMKQRLDDDYLSSSTHCLFSTEGQMQINGHKLHTPPMLFSKDIMEVQHCGITISVSAADAIYSWVAKVKDFVVRGSNLC